VFLDELASILVTAHVGVLGTSIFLSSQSSIPAGDGPYLSLKETGGTSPDRTHDLTIQPAYPRPAAQIVGRAKSYVAARAMAQAAYNALVVIRNATVLTTWYVEIAPMQEVFDMGLDDKSRVMCGFNVIAKKRPS
jgi:hypothetical protein